MNVMKKYKGKFITFEGAEGSGKSTQIALLRKYLQKQGVPTLFIREPGGVKISEKIRNLLLDVKNKQMCPETDMLLYMAARAQLTFEVIEPALKKGEIVLCDRFLDSTVVYQGYGSGIDVELIKKVGMFATRDINPDITFLFDISAVQGMKRIAARSKDRIEQRALGFHRKVRAGYLSIAEKEPNRIKVIDSMQSIDEIYALVQEEVNRILRI